MKKDNLITSSKQRIEILTLFFKSKVKNLKPNLVLKTDSLDNKQTLFTIGTYIYNSVSGVDSVEPLVGPMNYNEIKEFLTNEFK